jgi:ABC-type transporter Mla MlaB component
MFRVTVHEEMRAVTFQIEGRLAGAWVRELENCWRNTLASQRPSAIRVDLTDVTLVDPAGKACLEAMYHQGAEFIAADCLTKSIVAEFTHSPVPENEHRDFTGKCPQ